MPHYPIAEIQLLLETAALKVGAPKLEKNTFIRISKAIKNEENAFEPELSTRYLQNSIWKQIQKNISKGESSINLSENYVDTLSYFVGHNSFNAYQQEYSTLSGLISSLPQENQSEEVLIIHNSKEAELNKLKKLIEGCGLKALWFTPKDKAIIQEKSKTSLSILVYDKSLASLELGDIIPQAGANAPLLLPYLNDKENYPNLPLWLQEKTLLHPGNLPTGLALLNSYLKGEPSKSPAENFKNQLKELKASDTGTIILGNNTQISGEYISGRDMYINRKDN